MHFFSTFFRAFWSAGLYRRLRHEGKGLALLYSIELMLLTVVIATALIVYRGIAQFGWDQASLDFSMQLKVIALELPTFAMVLAVAFLGRLGMLAALALAGALASFFLKPQMGFMAAFRVTAVSYTPVAVADAVYFGLNDVTVGPFVLFVCGLVMLLAAVATTRS